jgi:hypothetical protein
VSPHLYHHYQLEVCMLRQIALPTLIVVGLVLSAKSSATGEKSVDAKEPAKECLDAARRAYEYAWNEFSPFDLSKGDGEKVYRWSRRWMEAERDMAANKAKRLAAFQSHLERMKILEKEVHDYGSLRSTIPVQQMAATTFYRAEAETWLAEEKAK